MDHPAFSLPDEWGTGDHPEIHGVPPGCTANQVTKSRIVVRYAATVLGSRTPSACWNSMNGFHDSEPGDRRRVRDRVRRQPEVIVNWFAELATSMS